MLTRFPFFVFFRFCSVGTICLALDAGIVTLLSNFWSWPPIASQCIGFVITVLFSWILNRHFTFRVRSKKNLYQELQRYVSIYSFGFVLNWGVYIGALYTHELFYHYPALALIPATGASMFFNFFGAKNLAFRS